MNIKLYPKIRKVFAAASLLLASQAVNAQYCTPVAGTNGNCKGTTPLAGDHIISVKTSGAVQNINNPNNACNTATGYTDYTNTVPTNRCIANAATNVTCSVDVFNHGQTLYPYRICVWVDWNQNDTFDNTPYSSGNPTGELMIVTPLTFTGYTTTSTAFNTIVVPPTAKNGLTRMRVRAGTRNGQNPPFPPTNFDPCNALSFQWGEVEDYDFEVINPCLPPKQKTTTNLTYKSATINWTKHPTAIMYEYWISQLNVPPTSYGYYYTTNSFVALPDTATIPALNCDTKYYYWVRSICDTVGNSSYNWEYSPWRLDSFTTPPCCYIPEVSISYISSTTAVASWTPVPSVVQYEYAVRYDTITPLKGTITTSTSVLLKGLAPATETYFFLRAHCSPTPYSEWGLDSFLTQPGTGINPVGEVKEFRIQAFPNPAKDKISMRVTKGLKQGMGYIEIVDLAGRVMKKEQMESDVQEISIDAMPAGVYIIKYTDDKHSNVIKLNKE
jgi:hypothetical protein